MIGSRHWQSVTRLQLASSPHPWGTSTAPSVVRSVGGSSGGGSRLTPFALALMDEYRRLHKTVRDCADEAFDRSLKKVLAEASRAAGPYEDRGDQP